MRARVWALGGEIGGDGPPGQVLGPKYDEQHLGYHCRPVTISCPSGMSRAPLDRPMRTALLSRLCPHACALAGHLALKPIEGASGERPHSPLIPSASRYTLNSSKCTFAVRLLASISSGLFAAGLLFALLLLPAMPAAPLEDDEEEDVDCCILPYDCGCCCCC